MQFSNQPTTEPFLKQSTKNSGKKRHAYTRSRSTGGRDDVIDLLKNIVMLPTSRYTLVNMNHQTYIYVQLGRHASPHHKASLSPLKYSFRSYR